MVIKDKYDEEYNFELMEQNSEDQYFVTQKVNELWENLDESLISNMLTTKYSPDGIPKTYLIKKDNKIVAFCSLLRNDVMLRTDITPWFGNCYVESNFRHRGLMTIMQDFICNEAKKLNYSKIFLWTTNKELYTSSGWEYLEEIRVDDERFAYLFFKEI